MDRRQNFYDTLHHTKPKEMIIDFGGNPLSSMEGESEQKLLDFLGFGKKNSHITEELSFAKSRKLDERLLKHYDIDTRSIGEIFRPQDSLYQYISDTEYIDEWGLKRVFTGMYWDSINTPLKNATIEDLEKYKFPDPNSINMKQVNDHAENAKFLYEHTDYVICAEHPVYGVFELGCWLCGFEDFLYKMALDEEFVHRFFEKVLEYQKKVIEIYYSAVGKYVHYTSSGDDFATQNAPFISQTMFSELIKPYYKERIAYTKKFTNAAYLHHSCGSVYRLIDDIIDMGVDILNPIQPKATDMQPKKLKDTFGDRIVFHGGIDTQELLPFATDEEIDQTVRNTIKTMNVNGGYIFAAAHNIQPDVNPRSLNVMLEAAKKYRSI